MEVDTEGDPTAPRLYSVELHIDSEPIGLFFSLILEVSCDIGELTDK